MYRSTDSAHENEVSSVSFVVIERILIIRNTLKTETQQNQYLAARHALLTTTEEFGLAERVAQAS